MIQLFYGVKVLSVSDEERETSFSTLLVAVETHGAQLGAEAQRVLETHGAQLGAEAQRVLETHGAQRVLETHGAQLGAEAQRVLETHGAQRVLETHGAQLGAEAQGVLLELSEELSEEPQSETGEVLECFCIFALHLQR